MPKKKSILVFAVDLFDGRNSGAQRVYEILIERNPQIEFEYFVRKSILKKINPPPNVDLIEISDSTTLDFDSLVPFASNRSFVYIDVPDWLWANSGIRNSLRNHNVQFEKIIVAAHGDAGEIRKHAYNGASNLYEAKQISKFQREMYYTADYLYGLNPIDPAWKDANKRFIAINPVDLIEESFWNRAMTLNSKLDQEEIDQSVQKLIFFGRQDGHKGIHLTLDVMAQKVTEELTLDLVGPESFDTKEASLVRIRKSILKDRISFDMPLGRAELFDKLSSSEGVVIVPSLYESFCIAALELFFLNTRVVIDSKIPAVRFIRKYMSTPNFYVFNTLDRNRDLVVMINQAKNARVNVQEDFKNKKLRLEKNSDYIRAFEFSENLNW